jgi:hypothetical protein
MIKSSYPEDADPSKPILRFDSLVLYPPGIFPLEHRKEFYSLSEQKTYWMFPPIGAWQHVLMKRMKQVKFVLLVCPHLINHEELLKYGLTNKHLLYFCTNSLLNVFCPEAHDLTEFEKWYSANIDPEGGYYCTEDKITSFQLMTSRPWVIADESTCPGYFGVIQRKQYSMRKTQAIPNTFRYCEIVRNLLKLDKWPEAKTVIVTKTKPSELVENDGKTRLEVMLETANNNLGYFKYDVRKKSGIYINKKGHFSLYDAGRWFPEGELVVCDGGCITSLLTGIKVNCLPRMFFQSGLWLHVLALDITHLSKMLVPMFDKIIFFDDKNSLFFGEEDELVLRRCAKHVIIFSAKPVD